MKIIEKPIRVEEKVEMPREVFVNKDIINKIYKDKEFDIVENQAIDIKK